MQRPCGPARSCNGCAALLGFEVDEDAEEAVGWWPRWYPDKNTRSDNRFSPSGHILFGGYILHEPQAFWGMCKTRFSVAGVPVT